ncbi:hypothetical protein MA16_Dca018954 [Dendrobium catenatum]|uniref:Ubiquitin-like protease family profile domain-containing protein n=1 Tax=Dendrobium catenatum TaxID=906689 RepID=A0A2I0WNT5_9ASPA|nr:hypothetical protein MA16_Dca018954 [Dendrobium catenatum]
MQIYVHPISYRCYVSTFRTICDTFSEIIALEIEEKSKNLNIYQFLHFPEFEQKAPLIYQLLIMWNIQKQSFIIEGHIVPFTADEVALLAGLPNKGEEITWLTLPTTTITSKGYGNVIVSRREMDKILSNDYLDNDHIDSFSILLNENAKIFPDKYHKFIYISQMYWHYKLKDLSLKLFIEHINYNSVHSCNIILNPIIDGSHWTLLVGYRNQKKWEFYDSVLNPIHRSIAIKIVSLIGFSKKI